MFINTVGYLMVWLTLAGDLQEIYIGGGNDLYLPTMVTIRSSWPKPPDDGARSAP
jgi:hypothetical protein